MANDLIKAIIKGATALVGGGFVVKVANEGNKNFNTWREKQKLNNKQQ